MIFPASGFGWSWRVRAERFHGLVTLGIRILGHHADQDIVAAQHHAGLLVSAIIPEDEHLAGLAGLLHGGGRTNRAAIVAEKMTLISGWAVSMSLTLAKASSWRWELTAATLLYFTPASSKPAKKPLQRACDCSLT